jgi:hypothetical protein
MVLNRFTNPDWPKQAADAVDNVVMQVRDKGTAKVVFAARALVFGLLAAIGGLVALVLFLVGSTRAVQVIAAEVTDSRRAAYISYLVMGTIFVLIGLILMRKRYSNEVST